MRGTTVVRRRAVRVAGGLVLVGALGGCGLEQRPPLQRSVATTIELDAVGRGRVLQGEGDDAGALRAYESGFTLPPARAKFAYFNAGVIEQNSGNTAAAESHYLAAVKLDDTFVEPIYNLGTLYRAAGRRDEAIARFKAVLDLTDRQSRPSLLNLAEMSAEAGDSASAERYRAEAAKIAPPTTAPANSGPTTTSTTTSVATSTTTSVATSVATSTTRPG
ncbi:MAG TPA: hypothetical protein PKD80_15885 [Microthrixaceae bacterium]|jgi:tetratricopeptide (TPR) repeat protein|nr:hypothetical protein [Microthrixaceae bacterium]HMT25654.1 hypothetical protein [Microthrixaceae bacterium]HMT61408.1 hypothetical protein [Microthrixaceae bacterium]